MSRGSASARRAAAAALLILAAMACRRIGLEGHLRVILGYLRSAIYLGLFAAWGVSVRRRVVQRQARRYLVAAAALMVFWIALRTVKYFLVSGMDAARFCWYLYYLPIIFIPLLAVFSAMSLGRPEDFRLKEWTALLYVPAAALLVLVLTNDLHQLVFAFPPDAAVRTDHDCGYGAGYWAVMGWDALCGLTAMGTMLLKCRVPRSRTVLWLPIVPMVLAVLYTMAMVLRAPAVHFLMGDTTVSLCLFFAAFFECCIQCGLIQSNTSYDELFRTAGIRAVITDSDYNTLLSAAGARPPDRVLMRRTETAPVILDGGVRLCGAPISCGRVVWSEDVSEVCGLLSQLREVNGRLAGNNDLLEAENDMKKRRARVAEKDRLYDKVAREVLPQFRELDKLFSRETDKPAREKLKKLCVYGTYIKRRCNLLLLREDKDTCSAKELEYCLRESCEALSAAGVDSSFRRSCGGEMPIRSAVLLYDLLEELVEAMLPSLASLFLNVTISGGETDMRLLADHSERLPADFRNTAELYRRGGTWSVTRDGGTTSAVLHLPKGGAGA